MGRIREGLILAALLTVAAGCSASPQPVAAWISNHGGLQPSTDPRQARINALARPLFASCSGRSLIVQVISSDIVTAYSLGDGHIFVTRGLMDQLDDSEIQAAVAHELGHLLGDGRVNAVASLRGGTGEHWPRRR